MNVDDVKRIFTCRLPHISGELKRAIEFTLENWSDLRPAPEVTEAKNFLTKFFNPFMDGNKLDKEFISRLNIAGAILKNEPTVWFNLEDLPHEKWRDVIGYEDDYQVSNYGRMKSFKGNSPRILRAGVTSLQNSDGGYETVALCVNSVMKSYQVHILVAQLFIPNPENKLVVHHRNNNKLNNFVWNLKWATHSENIRYAYQDGLMPTGAKRSDASLTKEQRIEILETCIIGDSKFGAAALARKFGVSSVTVSRVFHGETYKDVT